MARTRAKADPPEPTGPDLSPEERAELDARLAKMLTKPLKSGTDDNFFLLWTQRDANDAAQVMMWHPETAEELRGANLFHDAAHGLGAFTKKVAKGKPFRRGATETALINAILENRRDETGYLVYADYLTENGNSHGDFIRLCVELQHLAPGAPGYEEKSTRQQELLDAHAEEWFAPLGALGLRPEFYGRFTAWLWLSGPHGVIDSVTIDRPELLPDHADRLFAAAPFLRKIEFAKGMVRSELAKVKQLKQIEELELSYADVSTETLTAVLRSKHLTGLKALLLNGNDLGAAGALVLASWPGLAHLDTLDVTGCALGAGFPPLASSAGLSGLKRLRIGQNGLGPSDLSGLLRSPHLKQLAELALGSTEIDRGCAAALGTSVFAPALTHLDLNSATFREGAFAAFATCRLPALRELTLNSVRLRAPEAEMLARAPFAGSLTALSFDACDLGPAGAEALGAGTYPAVTTLDLSRNKLATRGGLALAGAAQHFPALTTLKLWSNKLTPDAVGALAGSALCAHLTELDLTDNKIGPAGALALAKSKHLKHLKVLALAESAVGKKGKQALLDRFGEEVLSWR